MYYDNNFRLDDHVKIYVPSRNTPKPAVEPNDSDEVRIYQLKNHSMPSASNVRQH